MSVSVNYINYIGILADTEFIIIYMLILNKNIIYKVLCRICRPILKKYFYLYLFILFKLYFLFQN
jgi:hypothetical protein